MLAGRNALVLVCLLALALAVQAAAPTVSIVYPASSQTINTSQPQIQFTVTENGAAIGDYNMVLDGGSALKKGNSSLSATTSGTTTTVSFTPSTALSDGTHTLYAGGTSADSNAQYAEAGPINFTVSATTASSAPTNTRINAPAFTRISNPKLILRADGNPTNMRLSCNQNGPWDANISYTATPTIYSDFNVLNTAYGCTPDEGLKDVWVQFAASNNQWSDANKASVFYDVTKPSKPANLAASLRSSDNAVSLTWDPSTDNSNGTIKYNVYRADDINFSSETTLTLAPQALNSYYDKKVKDGSSYYYRVSAVDAAGNESDRSEGKSVVAKAVTMDNPDQNATQNTGPAISEKDIKVQLLRADGKETTSVRKEKITVKGSFAKKLINVNVALRLPGGQLVKLIDATKPAESDNLDSFSKEFDMSTAASGKGQVLFKANDPANGNDLAFAIDFTVDTDEPAVTWINPDKEKASFAGKVVLRAKASDKGSGLDHLVYAFKELRTAKTGEIGTLTKDDNGFYNYEWKFDNYYNGAYAVTATAYDKAGNSAVALMKEVNITGGKNPDKEINEGKLADLQAKKADIDKLADKLKKQNVVSTKLVNARDQVEADISQAQSLQAAKNYPEAQKKIADALSIIAGLPNLITVTEAKRVDYSLEQAAWPKALKDAGFDDKLAQKAIDLIKSTGAKRTLQLLEIKEADKTSYQVNILVSLANKGADKATYKVIEVIPKEFAATAKDVQTQETITVLNADPSIQFTAELAKGEARDFVYSLNKALSKDAAKAFVDAEPLKLFPAPPIVLDAKEEVKEVKQQATRIDLTPVLAVMAVAIVIGLIVFFVRSRPGGGGLASTGSGIAGVFQQIGAAVKGALPGKKKAGGASGSKAAAMARRLDFLDERNEEGGLITFKRPREAPGFGGKQYEPLFINPEDGSARPKAPERKLNPLERLIEEKPVARPTYRAPVREREPEQAPYQRPNEFMDGLKKKFEPKPAPREPEFEAPDEEPRPAPRKKGGSKWGYGSE